MSLSQKLAALRKKPRRVRERILFVCMVVIAIILAIVWYFTYKSEPINIGKDFAQDIVGGISKSFSDPVYDQTFKTPSIEELRNGTGSATTQ